MLHVSFNADETPERQGVELRKIPSSERVDHAELRAAIEHYESARDAELHTRRAHTQAEQELPAAEYRDEVALADAQAKAAKDPGPVNAEKHRRFIQECKRQHGAAKITLDRAIDGVNEAFAQHGDEWVTTLRQDRDELRAGMAYLLSGWESVYGQLQRTVANIALVDGSPAPVSSYVSAIKAPRVIDGNFVPVEDVVAGLRDLGAPREPESPRVPEHRPPSQQPHAGSFGRQQMGMMRDPKLVKAWQRDDEQAAVAAAPPGPRTAQEREEFRERRMAQADERRAAREAQMDHDNELAGFGG